MRSLGRLCCGAALGLLLSGGACAAASLYVLTDLGVLPGDLSSEPQGINNLDQVVGFSTAASGDRGFIWDAHSGMREVGDLPGGAVSSHANAINDQGYIVGWSETWNAMRHAYLFVPGAGQGMRDLGALGSSPAWRWSWANGVSAQGDLVVGTSNTGGNWHAFVWTNANGMVDLGALMQSASAENEAAGLNASGQVVGVTDGNVGHFAPFIVNTNGSGMTTPASSPSGVMVLGQAINNAGVIVGVGLTPQPTPGYYYDTQVAFRAAQGIGQRLPDLPGAPTAIHDDYSAANAINNNDWMVGWGMVGASRHAALWRPIVSPSGAAAYGVQDLNDAIFSCDPLYGKVVLADARAINDSNDIAAVGVVGTTWHAFLLTRAKRCDERRPVKGLIKPPASPLLH